MTGSVEQENVQESVVRRSRAGGGGNRRKEIAEPAFASVQMPGRTVAGDWMQIRLAWNRRTLPMRVDSGRTATKNVERACGIREKVGKEKEQ